MRGAARKRGWGSRGERRPAWLSPDVRRGARRLAAVLPVVLAMNTLGVGTGSAQQPIPGPGDSIAERWETIYRTVPVEVPPAPPAVPSELREHTTIGYGVEYTRNIVRFSGRPTRTGVVNAGPALTETPEGFVSFPPSFEPNDDRLYQFLQFGTRGYGNDRVNTFFSIVDYRDLDGIPFGDQRVGLRLPPLPGADPLQVLEARTPPGSPFPSSLDAFSGGNRTHLVTGFGELTGLAADGPLANLSIRVGRHYIQDFLPGLLGSPLIDGGTVSYRDSRLEVSAFSGLWRTFFGDPANLVTFGGSVSYRVLPALMPYLNYHSIEGSDRYAIGLRQELDTRLGRVVLDGYQSFIDANPIDFAVRATYQSPAGNWAAYGKFVRTWTDEDFPYDAFLLPPDRERPTRLFLLQTAPGTEFSLDVDYQVTRWLAAGIGTWVRFLDDRKAKESFFDTSFEEVVGRLVLTPPGPLSYSAQVRFRHFERESSTRAVFFDDVRQAGERHYSEVNGEIRYQMNSSLSAYVGGYYANVDFETRLTRLGDIDYGGGYVGARGRLREGAHLSVHFGIDNANREFNPEIGLQYTARVGLDFQY